MLRYLFTFHGYATWMPDRKQGYVHRTQGLQPRDDQMADVYRLHQREPAVVFTSQMQSLLINTARQAGGFIDATIYGVAADISHLHVLIGWGHERSWKSMRTSVRSALTRAMNQEFGKRTWFSDTPSRKQVSEETHFQYLIESYLPKHNTVWIATQQQKPE